MPHLVYKKYSRRNALFARGLEFLHTPNLHAKPKRDTPNNKYAALARVKELNGRDIYAHALKLL